MKQITSRISDALFIKLEAESKNIDRSISYTVDILLQQAVKERLRKRNGKKPDTKSNPQNLGQSNRQR